MKSSGKSFKIVSKFYVIYGDGVPIYVGYTNRTVKQRFTEHKHNKDFSDYDSVESIELKDQRMRFDFTWNYNKTCENADEVSKREEYLVNKYCTQDIYYQRAIGGGQTWAFEKWFVKTNKGNPRFTGMSGLEIKSRIEKEKAISVDISSFANHMSFQYKANIANFVSSMKSQQEVDISGFVSCMEPQYQVNIGSFIKNMSYQYKVDIGDFLNHMNPQYKIDTCVFVSTMKSQYKLDISNFVEDMKSQYKVDIGNFINNMKPKYLMDINSFVKDVESQYKVDVKSFVSNMRPKYKVDISHFISHMKWRQK